MKKATTRRTSIEIETQEITIIRQKAPGGEICPNCGADTTHAAGHTQIPALDGVHPAADEPCPAPDSEITGDG